MLICPVCFNPVHSRTVLVEKNDIRRFERRIAWHRDNCGKMCQATNQPFEIAQDWSHLLPPPPPPPPASPVVSMRLRRAQVQITEISPSEPLHLDCHTKPLLVVPAIVKSDSGTITTGSRVIHKHTQEVGTVLAYCSAFGHPRQWLVQFDGKQYQRKVWEENLIVQSQSLAALDKWYQGFGG